jgi:thiol-disulfide isomerase/thioredoxin
VEDFVLSNLEGAPVRLSDYWGKMVWLNFWTTRCPGCQAEILILIRLQNNYPDDLVVLGISSDGESDVHSHATGHHHDHNGHHESDTETEPPPREAVRDKVRKFAGSKGIQYPVLLDPASEVGRRFNGYELPTNVLIDHEGRMWRRFIGRRPLIVMENMLAEIQRGEMKTSTAAGKGLAADD